MRFKFNVISSRLFGTFVKFCGTKAGTIMEILPFYYQNHFIKHSYFLQNKEVRKIPLNLALLLSIQSYILQITLIADYACTLPMFCIDEVILEKVLK